VADIFYYVQSHPLFWQLGEAGREVVDWIHLPWDRVQGKPSVNTSHELSGFMEGGTFLVPRRIQQRVKHDSIRWKWLISYMVSPVLNFFHC